MATATANALNNNLGPQAGQERAQAVQEMFKIVSGFWLSRSVQVAATLGIADLVADGAKSIDELATATSTNGAALYRLLRGLASFGIFREAAGRKFEQTPMSAVLQKDQPGSLRSAAITELGNMHYASWANLIDCVRTGEPAFDKVYGMDPWQYFQQNPDKAELFDDSMTRITEVVQRAVMQVYDFSPFRRVVDIAGGQGRLLASILAENPAATGVLFDRGQVIDEAQRVLSNDPSTSRIEFVPGDFFTRVPAGGDLYTLKWIIHDWAEEQALRILRNVRTAMTPGARVLLLECVLPEANTPDFGPLMDLNMLVMTGGRERRASEYRDLLASAGLRMTRVYPTESPVAIVESVAA